MFSESAVKVKVSLGVRLKLGLNTFINFRHTVSSAGCPENVDHFFIFQKPKALLKYCLLLFQIIMILSIFLSKFLGRSVTTFEILIRIVEDILL